MNTDKKEYRSYVIGCKQWGRKRAMPFDEWKRVSIDIGLGKGKRISIEDALALVGE